MAYCDNVPERSNSFYDPYGNESENRCELCEDYCYINDLIELNPIALTRTGKKQNPLHVCYSCNERIIKAENKYQELEYIEHKDLVITMENDD